jgi:hypothetical protein
MKQVKSTISEQSSNKLRISLRIVCLAALFSFNGVLPGGTAQAADDPLKNYTRSIVNEALYGTANATRGGTFIGSGIITNTASSLKSQADQGFNTVNPSILNLLPSVQNFLPSIPVQFADGRMIGSLSPQTTNISYSGDNQQANLNLGLGYYNSGLGKKDFAGMGGVATMLGNNLSLGASVLVNGVKKDLVLNSVFQLPQSGLRIKVTGGYLWGNQLFAFRTGNETIDVKQYSGAFSTSWISPAADPDGNGNFLHSFGFTVWEARAHQASHPDPVFTSQETATEYLVYKDPLALSEGRLFGAAADAQVALTSCLVAKGSLGYEQLKFPFADGTQERNNSPYSSLALYWEPFSTVTFGGEVKNGASEKRYTLSLQSGHWKIDSWYSKGKNSLVNDKGVMLNYSLAIFSGQNNSTLAARMQPSRTNSPSLLLNDALTRPTQLPLTFLAKVDPTAITLISSVKKAGLPDSADPDGAVTVEPVVGDLYISVGNGRPQIQEVRLSGNIFPYAGIFGVTDSQIVVNTSKLVQTGIYVISVKDINGNNFGIELTAQ